MWQDTHMRNGKSLLKKEVDMIINSNASLVGWGATYQNQWTGGLWSLVEGKMHIILPEAIGCKICSPCIPEEQKQNVSTPQVGQHHSRGVHQQPRSNSLQRVGRLGKESLDEGPVEEHPHHSPTPTRCLEQDGRCRVSDYDRSIRLAAESSLVQQDC